MRFQPFIEIYNVLIPFMCICMAISILSNTTSVIFLRNLNIQRKKAETNFLLIMSITCLVQLIGTIISIALLKCNYCSMLSYLTMVLPFVSDGLSLVQPWLLICFSKTVRVEI